MRNGCARLFRADWKCHGAVSWIRLSLCFSSLDLKRKGIEDLFSEQTVQLGCDSWNNASYKTEAFVAVCFWAQYRAETKGRFRMNTNHLLTFNVVSVSRMGLYFVYINFDFLSVTFHIHSGESSSLFLHTYRVSVWDSCYNL